MADNVSIIARAFKSARPAFSVLWLLFGEGEMFDREGSAVPDLPIRVTAAASP